MKQANLFAPESYWNLDPVLKEAIESGCGPEGFFGWLIPETIYGLKITAACNIHDYMYAVGKTEEDRLEADSVFLNNMIRIIDTNTKWGWLKRLRYARAKTYYNAVSTFGGPFYWEGKNPSATMQLVSVS
jgi:hypothetical protein